MTNALAPAAADLGAGPTASPRRSAPATWFAALSEADAAGSRYLLLLRFLLINLVAVALVAAVWTQGWLDDMIATDKYHLVKLNIGVFLVGLGLCGSRIVQLSHELNDLNENRIGPRSRAGRYLRALVGKDSQSRALTAESLKLKFGARIGGIRQIANTIVLFGLIGTIIGFIIALSGVNAEAATDAEAITPMVSTLILGMSIALYKTLVGSILNVWLMINYRLLDTGTVHLVTSIIERGENHARL
ncbi:MAG: MotA/TolQ/ExbB proton channel family protein [Geminicoccaceae bacterium]